MGPSGLSFVDGTTTTVIAADSPDLMYGRPRMNSSGQIVWTTYPGVLYLCTGTTASQIATATPARYPQINDSTQIVWTGLDGTDAEIFLYDNATIRQLTTNNYSDGEMYGPPQINSSGEIVWTGIPEPTPRKFFCMADRCLLNSSRSILYLRRDPRLSNNGHVVWLGGAANPEIFLYNGVQTLQLTSNGYFNGLPFYGALPDSPSPSEEPEIAINASGQVVWSTALSSGNHEIFFYDGITTTQLTNECLRGCAAPYQ